MSGRRSDWPGPGPIDLAVHDLPHPACGTEWWYVNAHLRTGDGGDFSLFAAFFRWIRGVDETTNVPIDAYSMTWALSDMEGRVYYPESRVDKNAPQVVLERIRAGGGTKDPRVNRALAEILERDRVPSPDRVFDRDVHVATNRLDLDFGGSRFEKRHDGRYRLRLCDPRTRNGCDLTFVVRKPVQRHGNDGVVYGPSGEEMFYYFAPRCEVSGEVTVRGVASPIVAGTGWYDHEFGAHPDKSDEPAPPVKDVAWNWASIQLDDDTDVTVYTLVHVDDGAIVDRRAIVVDPAGEPASYSEFSFEPTREWRSTRTFFTYPAEWTLCIPCADLSLEIRASFDDQEFLTVISKPAFWEGRCEVAGTVRGRAVRGLAYVERSGFEPIKDLDSFFGAVGEEVRKSVAELMPLELTLAHATELVVSKEREHCMNGVDLPQLSDALIRPIREIADRGGKSWRSYAALACVDVVGGDSRKFVQWLAMPELMHVGSLIVDDVQDRSVLRRGGPSCHVMYGEAIAINAGTAAYFLTQHFLDADGLSDAVKLRLYDLYFEALRGGHAGQALDLAGLDDLMARMVQTGESTGAERRILAAHRLKAAVPAASLARMGAIAGGGSEDQVEAVGQLFEALGLAFQIVDDVLNVRGFNADLKTRGEDIMNGTVTLPVAKAMGLLPERIDREWLWETLRSKPRDPALVREIICRLEACGAIAACADMARDLVESAWATAEPLFDDSLVKVMLRAFGWYILERHY